MPALSYQRLLSQLSYDPLTGVFAWKVSRHRIVAGAQAGSVNSKGYRVIRIDGEHHKAHRLAWFYTHGVWPVGIIDHRDGVGDHNWLTNLRDTTQQVNTENKKTPRKRTTSSLMGVSYVKRLNKYKAEIKVNGICKYLGVFANEQDAHNAYMTAKRQFHPGFV